MKITRSIKMDMLQIAHICMKMTNDVKYRHALNESHLHKDDDKHSNTNLKSVFDFTTS